MTEPLDHFRKYRAQYEEAVLRYVCTRCIDFGNDGVCYSEDPKGCAVFRYLPELIEIAKSVHEPSIGPYVDAVRQNVCVYCRSLTPEGTCPLRAKLDCGLDRYLILVMAAMEKVESILDYEEKVKTKLRNKSKTVTILLMQRYREVLDKIKLLGNVLAKFHSDEKVSFEKKTKQLKEIIIFFEREWNKHIEIERDVLFPFTRAHLPKVEPAIHLLESKREEYKKNLLELRSEFNAIQSLKNELSQKKLMDKLQKSGLRMTELFKSYVDMEAEKVYKILDRELCDDEKLELMEKMHFRNVIRRAA